MQLMMLMVARTLRIARITLIIDLRTKDINSSNKDQVTIS